MTTVLLVQTAPVGAGIVELILLCPEELVMEVPGGGALE